MKSRLQPFGVGLHFGQRVGVIFSQVHVVGPPAGLNSRFKTGMHSGRGNFGLLERVGHGADQADGLFGVLADMADFFLKFG